MRDLTDRDFFCKLYRLSASLDCQIHGGSNLVHATDLAHFVHQNRNWDSENDSFDDQRRTKCRSPFPPL